MPEGADDTVARKAEAIAKELATRLQSSGDMKALVETLDPKGELGLEYAEFGFLTRGVLEPPVEEAACGYSAVSIAAMRASVVSRLIGHVFGLLSGLL